MTTLVASYKFTHGPGKVPNRIVKFKRNGGTVYAKVYSLKTNTKIQHFAGENILVEMMNTSKKIEMIKSGQKQFLPDKPLSQFSILMQNDILGELEPIGTRRVHVGDVYLTIFDIS